MSAPINSDTFIPVLGKDWGDPLIEALVRSLSCSGTLKHIEQLGFYECREQGVSLAFKDKIYLSTGGKKYARDGPVSLIGAHLYSPGYEGYRGFSGILPKGLSFDDGREAVRQKMGAPSASGGGNEALGRVWPYWDRFDFPTHAVRVQFPRDLSRIDIVTLLAPSEVAG